MEDDDAEKTENYKSVTNYNSFNSDKYEESLGPEEVDEDEKVENVYSYSIDDRRKEREESEKC